MSSEIIITLDLHFQMTYNHHTWDSDGLDCGVATNQATCPFKHVAM